ncbi:hypothetical protein ZWY2020_030716 [Hordeum vulgare]|nr:hypothetical protein ZWY2020_030716 [Hordeum vulgare]
MCSGTAATTMVSSYIQDNIGWGLRLRHPLPSSWSWRSPSSCFRHPAVPSHYTSTQFSSFARLARAFVALIKGSKSSQCARSSSHDQVPDAQQAASASAFFLSIFGWATSSVVSPYPLIDGYTKKSGASWFSNNLNRAHLDYFYWLLAGLCAAELAAFVVVSRVYVYKKRVAHHDHDHHDGGAVSVVITSTSSEEHRQTATDADHLPISSASVGWALHLPPPLIGDPDCPSSGGASRDRPSFLRSFVMRQPHHVPPRSRYRHRPPPRAEEPVAALMEVAVRASPRSLVVGNGWPEPGSAHPEPFLLAFAATLRLGQLAIDRGPCSLSSAELQPGPDVQAAPRRHRSTPEWLDLFSSPAHHAPI